MARLWAGFGRGRWPSSADRVPPRRAGARGALCLGGLIPWGHLGGRACDRQRRPGRCPARGASVAPVPSVVAERRRRLCAPPPPLAMLAFIARSWHRGASVTSPGPEFGASPRDYLSELSQGTFSPAGVGPRHMAGGLRHQCDTPRRPHEGPAQDGDNASCRRLGVVWNPESRLEPVATRSAAHCRKTTARQKTLPGKNMLRSSHDCGEIFNNPEHCADVCSVRRTSVSANAGVTLATDWPSARRARFYSRCLEGRTCPMGEARSFSGKVRASARRRLE